MDNDIKAVIEDCGVSFYDDEVVNENENKIYRVYITTKDGVNLDKCGEVTKLISPLLDLNPPVGGKYFLEVSSPGLERTLKIPNHFKLSIGEKVRIHLYSTEVIEGILKEANDDSIMIGSDNIKYDDIKKARTYCEW